MPRTLAQNADYIANTIKPAIKSAIEAQGVTVSASDSFLDYATRISEIEGGGGGTARYELYDYIQSDGTQVIDTGREVIQGQELNVTFRNLSGQNAYAWILGGISSSAYYGFQFPSQSNIYTYNGSTSASTQEGISTDIITEKLMTFNGSISQHIHIFGLNDGSNYTNMGKFRVYSLSIGDDYYLPAKRKSDGVFGLYDVANETFLTDVAGGNAFTAGSKIMDIYS